MDTRTTQRGTPIGAIVRIGMIAALGACVVLGAQPKATFAASAKEKAHAVTLRERPDRSLASLDAAVKDHLLDAAVLTALTRTHSVDALVVFDGRDVRRTADIEAGKGKDRKVKVQAALKSGHKALKARALKDAAGVSIVKAFDGVAVAKVRFTSKAGLLKVLSQSDVLGVEMSAVNRPSLKESLGLIKQPYVAQTLGYTGAGTAVAVMDTGVDTSTGYFGSCPTYPAPNCKVIESYDFGPTDNKLDDDGHGTNVAGIVTGVAPGAKILAYDVFTRDAAGKNGAKDENVIAAITRAKNLAATYNIRSMNLSIGAANSFSTTTCATRPDGLANPYTQAFADARLAGIVPVVSSGNDAKLANGSFAAGLSYPACTAGAVSVGAVYDSAFGSFTFPLGTRCTDSVTAQDKVTCFSQSSPNLTVLAPGSQITAAGSIYSGTSQAAPHVAGAVAVLASVRPKASVEGLIYAIANSGPQIYDARPGAGQKRRLDLTAAVGLLTSDSTKPVFSGNPSSGLDTDWTLAGNGLTAVKYAWHATDTSGVARYLISIKAGANDWADVSNQLATRTSESISFNLTPGTTYDFAVAAIDHYGNQSDWRFTGARTVGVVAENGSGVAFGGAGWTRTQSNISVGGYTTKGATSYSYVRYTIPANTGSTVGWVATSDWDRGQAKIYLNGAAVAVVDTYSSTQIARKIQYLTAIDPSRTNYLDVQILGTAGRPAIDVDAFVTFK